MATKKAATSPASLLITAIKKTVNKSSVLPILECVYLSGKEAIVSDLETHVSIPFKTGTKPVCLPSAKVITALEIIENPSWSVDDKFMGTVSGGSRKISLTGDDPDNFVKSPMLDKPYPSIGKLSGPDMEVLGNALDFVSTDDLRPAMTGVFIGGTIGAKKATYITATDAHRLFWQKMAAPATHSFILPAKSARILLALGGEWDMTSEVKGKKGQPYLVCFVREDGVKVVVRTIDARFPDYPVVIPKDEEIACEMLVDREPLMKEIKTAMRFANTSTKQVKFHMNGELTINSEDVDFKEGYETKLPAEVKFKKDPFDIAFNGEFLSQILSKQPAGEMVRFKFWGATKAACINEGYLVMPLMA